MKYTFPTQKSLYSNNNNVVGATVFSVLLVNCK